MKTVTWMVKATVGGGGQYYDVLKDDFEATKAISVTLPANEGGGDPVPTEIILSADGTHVRFLLVRLSTGSYEGVSYSTASDGDFAVLSSPLLLSGVGAVGLLGAAAAPFSLWFTNAAVDDAAAPVSVDLEILVAGDATVSA